MHPKDANEQANSVEPDQTAPKEQSGLGEHCLLRDVYVPIFRVLWYSKDCILSL